MDQTDQLEKTTSCFAVILYPETFEIALVHNEADPPGEDGEKGKPEGTSLPGGRAEKGETLFETILREVQEEAGIKIKFQEFEKEPGNKVKLPTICGPYESGAFLLERKRSFKGKPIDNDVYTFFVEPLNNELGRVIETKEVGRRMFATLGNILTMPSAIKTIKDANGKVVVEEYNKAGIYHASRRRIALTLHAVGKDFFDLIPNLPELLRKLEKNKDEIGSDVYDLLYAAVQARGINPAYYATDEELVERYQTAVAEKPAADPDEEYRRWFEK